MRFLSRPGDIAEVPGVKETRSAVTRGSRRRRLASIGAVLAVLAAAGTVAATAAPAEAAVTGAVVREGDFINVPAFGVADGAAICNPGEVVIGGGALIMNLDSSVRLSSSFANASFRWFVRIANPTSVFQEVHVRALCATNVAGYSQRTGPVSLPPFSSGNAGTASCPGGSVAIGGGFITAANDFDRPLIKVAESFPDFTNPALWDLGMRNDSGGFYSATVQVICTSQTNRSRPTGRTVTVGAGSVVVSTEDCGSASLVSVAGGYREVGDFPPAIVTGFLPTPGSFPYWKYNFSNPDPVTRRVSTFHACLPM